MSSKDEKPKKDWKQLSRDEWRELLSNEQYYILRDKGTERAFTGKYWNHFEEGVYTCAGCGAKLFESQAKFNSDCGWPSFSEPMKEEMIKEKLDTTFGMRRTEVLCDNCGGHLGHVFNDGPRERGGLRYCINSASLKFDKVPDEKPD
ncbi:MAG: peptide-methionine (R)-S-oxide reductase MsrB [Candidatus Heimdallarchaeota archaeon]